MVRDDTQAFDGKYSLRLPAGQRGGFRKIFLLHQPNQGYVLSFYARADKQTGLVATTWNDWWKYSGRGSFTIGTDWQRYQLTLRPQPRISSVSLNLQVQNADATVWFDAISFSPEGTSDYTASRTTNIGCREIGECGILTISEVPVQTQLAVYNAGASDLLGELRVDLEQLGKEQPLELAHMDVALKPGAGMEQLLVVLPRAERGYYVLRLSLSANGAVVSEYSMPFAIVDQPPPAREESFFGVHFAEGNIGRNIGASWNRSFVIWSKAPVDGRYRIKGDYLLQRQEQGVFQAPSIRMRGAPKSLLGQEGFPADAEIVKWLCAVVESYQGKIHYLELDNEPDLSFRGDADRYARLVNLAVPELRKIDPEAKIIGGSVSGVDFNQYLPFTSRVLELTGSSLDVVSVHPYVFNRYIDRDSQECGPETIDVYGKTLALHQKLLDMQSPAEVWFGEVGWALAVDEDYTSAAALQTASYIPRLMVLGKAAGVKKVFYFLVEECLERQRYYYGLWRSGRPLPSTSAYAAAVQALEFAEPLDVIANNDFHAISFAREDGKIVTALWLSTGQKAKIRVELPAGAEVRDWL